jgi:GGDEF domain-containing protein
VTVSIGGAVGRSEDASPTVATADAALYTAKAAGRNCAVVAEDRRPRTETSARGDASS